MARYIDVELLRKESKMVYVTSNFTGVEGYTQEQIDNAPIADVKEVARGKWKIEKKSKFNYEKAIKQLQEYENTGLTPAEIEQLQKENVELKARLEKSVELPCKVGDILYTNIGYKYSRLKNRPFSCEVVFIGLNYKYSILNVVYQDGSMEQFNSYDIGKTVFLTKEEAEQALKGGAKNA